MHATMPTVIKLDPSQEVVPKGGDGGMGAGFSKVCVLAEPRVDP